MNIRILFILTYYTNICINKQECANISLLLVLNHGRYYSMEFFRLTEFKDEW